MNLEKIPIVETSLLIRKPPIEVFEAFAEPAITTQFWFTKGTDRLESEKRVEWHWEMYGFSVPVHVKEAQPPTRIVIDWGEPGDITTVEWTFAARPDGTTFVTVRNYGFTGTGDEIVQKALDSMGGFNLVLAGCKAWLEHGLRLNLVADRFPKD